LVDGAVLKSWRARKCNIYPNMYDYDVDNDKIQNAIEYQKRENVGKLSALIGKKKNNFAVLNT
jgi:hypothetical protein